MENIETITGLILQEAKSKSATILDEAKSKAETFLNEQSAILEQDFQKSKETIKSNLNHQHENAMNHEDMKERKQLASFRQELFISLFDEAEQRMNDFTKEELFQFFEAAVKKSLLTGDCEVVLGECNNAKLTQADLDQVASKYEDLHLTLSEETIPYQGGFVLVQDIIEYDFLYRSLLNEINKDIGGEILAKLFE